MAPRRSPRKAAAAVVETSQTTKLTKTKTAVSVKANNANGKSKSTVLATVAETKSQVKRKAAEDIDYAEDSDTKSEVAEETPVKTIKKQKVEQKGEAKAKTKIKAEEGDTMPLATRTAIASLQKAMYIGAHVSGAGGVHNSIQNALQIGANAFALFLKSQRKWDSPPLSDDARDQFKSLCQKHGYDAAAHCLPHGSYLVNLAQPDPEKADKAFGNFVDDLGRCDALGIKLYNFHPGSALGGTKEEAIGRIAAQLNRAHRQTKQVITVVENMAGAGNVVGSRFEELRDIIEKVDDKSRVGVCIDSCHAFAAGYDMRTPETFSATMDEFDRVVGNKYLKALHLNDSKAPLASNKDLHANIGTGFLGLRAFHSIVNYPPFQGLPMVLETPIDHKGPDGKSVEDKQVWADEIKLLESLIDMDPDSDEFRELEKELQRKGAGERQRLQGMVDNKKKKDTAAAVKKSKAAASSAKRGRKKKAVETEDEDSD